MKYQLVFIGFGEAAFHIAAGLREEGFSDMAAYDSYAGEPGKGELIQKRAEDAGVELVSLKTAREEGRFIASMNSASAALSVAEEIIPHLKKGQVFVDFNSASPDTEEHIGRIPREEGVLFCDAGVMGTVPGNRHRVPIFLAGDGAQEFWQAFSPFHMRLTVLDAPAGGASAIKMLKSVVMKGLPQLMFESFIAAERYGVLDTLVDSLGESLNGKTVEKLADTFIARTMIHAKRRSAEMRDVLDTLEKLNTDASMTRAVVEKLDRLAEGHWEDKMDPGGNMGFREAIRLLETSGQKLPDETL